MVNREANPLDAQNFQVRVKLKRLSPDFNKKQTVSKRMKENVTKDNLEDNSTKNISKNILTVCLECGEYSTVYPVSSGFETHSCKGKNLNNFNASMNMIKTRAMNLINSHDLQPPTSSPTPAPTTSSPAPPPPAPPMPIPLNLGFKPHITLTYIVFILSSDNVYTKTK